MMLTMFPQQQAWQFVPLAMNKDDQRLRKLVECIRHFLASFLAFRHASESILVDDFETVFFPQRLLKKVRQISIL
jgi:hypothetical protein